MSMRHRIVLLVMLMLFIGGCGATNSPRGAIPNAHAPAIVRLATTTSTADSGLLDVILPAFEQQYNARVEVIAVGTGQALKLGENGDADVVLVHARSHEDAFVAKGLGINRRNVMYNDFVLVGPVTDPAGIAGMPLAAEAFQTIADTAATFASRGDDSGTHSKELTIWHSIGITPTAELNWYQSLGQGMGETLITANEQLAYTLADRGTYLALRDNLPNLTIVVGGGTIEDNHDPALLNPYSVILVNPERYPDIQAELAEQLAAWLVTDETQAQIATFGIEAYGQPLFFPGTAQ